MKRISIALVASAGLLALAACGSSGSSANGGNNNTSQSPATSPASTSSGSSGSSGALPTQPGSVTIGSADFPENALLADIYGDAMAAKGVKVSKKLNIGERGVYIAALKDGVDTQLVLALLQLAMQRFHIGLQGATQLLRNHA